MYRILLSIAFVISAIFAPWLMTVALGVILITYFDLWAVAILGGLLTDIIFGAPIPALGGFAYLYTVLFLVLSIFALTLRGRMLE